MRCGKFDLYNYIEFKVQQLLLYSFFLGETFLIKVIDPPLAYILCLLSLYNNFSAIIINQKLSKVHISNVSCFGLPHHESGHFSFYYYLRLMDEGLLKFAFFVCCVLFLPQASENSQSSKVAYSFPPLFLPLTRKKNFDS